MDSFDSSATKQGNRIDCSICHSFPFNRDLIQGCDYIACPTCNNTICLYCGIKVNENDGNMGQITSSHNTPGIQPTPRSFNAHFGFRDSTSSNTYPTGERIPNGGWCLERPGVRPFRNNVRGSPALAPAATKAPSTVAKPPIGHLHEIHHSPPLQMGAPAKKAIDLDKIAMEISTQKDLDIGTIKLLLEEIILMNPDDEEVVIKTKFNSMYGKKYLSLNMGNEYKNKYIKYKMKYLALKNLK